MSDTSLVIPVLNEEKALPDLIATVARLDPAPAEVLLVDGGSADRTVELARAAGWRIIISPQGRGVQINNCLLYTSPSPRD